MNTVTSLDPAGNKAPFWLYKSRRSASAVALFLVGVFLFCFTPGNLFAQDCPYKNFVQDSTYVAQLTDLEKHEFALHWVDSIHLDVQTETVQNCPQILWFKAVKAYLYDRIGQEEQAMRVALEVIDEAKELGDIATLIEARLTVALLLEKHGSPSGCKEELDAVAALLVNHELLAAKSRYHVRRASYERFFGDKNLLGDNAQQAINYGEKAGFHRGVSDGNFLLSLYFEDRDKIIYHLQESIRVNEEIGNAFNAVSLMINLARVNEKAGNLEESLRISDAMVSRLLEIPKAEMSDLTIPMFVYKDRADLKYKQGAYQEAYYYLAQSSALEIRRKDSLLQQQVREVEARYDMEKKDAILREREKELTLERAQTQRVRGALLLVALVGVLLAYLLLQLRDTKSKLEKKAGELKETNSELNDALNQQITLRGELHHRVKNNLQVIISLLNLQELKTGDMGAKKSLRATSDRVFSIAAVHELLYPKNNIDQIEFATYLNMLTEHSAEMWPEGGHPVFYLDSGNYSFNIETLVPLGVMISELLTNTRKYYKVPGQQPEISIALSSEGSLYQLEYKDNGLGFISGEMKERTGGMGKYLLQSMSRQLRGYFDTTTENGAVTRIFFYAKNEGQEISEHNQNTIVV